MLNMNPVWILYDDDMKVISEVYKYINIQMAGQADNSKEKAVYAFRLLYCFLKLFRANIKDLKQIDIERLKYFLLGYSPDKGSYSMQLQTVRRNSTVNGYLNVYRSFFKYIGIECSYLFDTKEMVAFGINPMSEQTQKVSKYTSNLKTGTPMNRVPKYISIENFTRITKIIRKGENKLGECIVRLMYQFGLRIGEVLGLTFEDLTEINIEGNLYPVLLIRNRLSDKHFQHAKTCMNISDTKQYKSKDYHTENYGYQKVIITFDIYEMLNSYIEEFHAIASMNNLKRYQEGAKADITLKDKYASENYYIFLNSSGTALSEQTWNKYLRIVFERAEIAIDSNSRKNNLNHRFRHGFAMFHVQYRKTPLLELQKLLRHASVLSTMVYYNPTEAEEAAIKNDFVNELYDLMPDLKRSSNNE